MTAIQVDDDNPFMLKEGHILEQARFSPDPARTEGSAERLKYRIIQRLTTPSSHGFSYKAVVVNGGQDSENEFVFIKTPNVDSSRTEYEIRARLAKIYNTFIGEYQNRRRLERLPGVARIKNFGFYEVTVDNTDTPVVIPYLVQEFIDGVTLQKYAKEKLNNGNGQFMGIQNQKEWFKLAKSIVTIIKRVHNQQIIHGDIAPRNILIVNDSEPVIVDFGQSFLLDQSFSRSDALSAKNPYRAPECKGDMKWYTPAEIYSIGGVLYFLATGDDPPQPQEEVEELKKTILDNIHKKNPGLLRDNEGIVKIIDKCLRFYANDRYSCCEKILSALDDFDPDLASLPVDLEWLDTLIREPSDTKSEKKRIRSDHLNANSFFGAILSQNMLMLRKQAEAMLKGHHEIYGDREEIIDSLIRYLSVLRRGDQYLTVTLPSYWMSNNLGVNGRFLTMNKVMALRGVIIRRVFLLTSEDRSNANTRKILQAHQSAIDELKSYNVDTDTKDIPSIPSEQIPDQERLSFYTGYTLMSKSERDYYETQGHHVALWRKVDGQCMSILFSSIPTGKNFDSEGQIYKVRFWSYGKQQNIVDEIENFLNNSRPLTAFLNAKPESD
ncbi:MAG TPA: protein kinase [Blastocatellia bacterium]|nr:protein kinase [Blastocatellia bacterium]